MAGIVDSVLTMKIDVYKQVDLQNSDTGELTKSWEYIRTMPCHAKGIISNSSNSRTGDGQTFKNKYSNDQSIQIRTKEKLTLREKITNVRNSQNVVIWTELDYPSNTPTVFELVGSTPILDPFGSIIGYNSTLKRSENQIIGL